MGPALVAALLVPLLVACGGPRVQTFLHPEADLGYYTTVGVIPFRSLASDRFAGEKFTTEFMTALHASQLFEVVDFGIFVNDVIKAIGARAPVDGLTGEQIRQIGEATGVQGIFEGNVSHYELFAAGENRFPVITVEARLIDVATGTVVWSATMTEKGGPRAPFVGFGEIRTLGELSQKVARDLVKELE
jgi:TolB-like protein